MYLLYNCIGIKNVLMCFTDLCTRLWTVQQHKQVNVQTMLMYYKMCGELLEVE